MRLLLCSMILAALAMTAAAADVTGKWAGTFTPAGGEESSAVVILKQTGNTVTGSGGPSETEQWPLSNGRITGSKLTGEVKNPEGTVYKLDLTIEGDRIKGDAAVSSPSGEAMKGVLNLTRTK